ncbi:MAG: V-type ATPase subunit subunit G family protein [Candidatus Methanofastidiosia archaeon]
MKKKDVLINIKQEEQRAQERIEKARKECERIIENARLEANNIIEKARKDAQKMHNDAIENFYNEKTEIATTVIKEKENLLEKRHKMGLKNVERAAAEIFEDFMRYIDAKTEENE